MKWQWICATLALATLTPAVPAWGHGARIEYRPTSAVEIQAVYDSGEPMAEAPVMVYAPEDPETAWLTGTTDSEGRFAFVPQGDGTWTVSVREAGHGDIINIPVGDTEESETVLAVASPTDYTPLQKAVMAASVIWGCAGTALYFSRRPS